MKHKSIIEEYNTIYPIRLVVANLYTTLKQIQKRYSYFDGRSLDDLILQGDASTSKCLDKKLNRHVILVKFNGLSLAKDENKKVMMINVCAHEACHAALMIHENINEEPCLTHQEPFAYLTGFFAECIYKTINK